MRSGWNVGGTPNPDADGDGMADAWETTYLGGTNAAAGDDADGDGMSNLDEYTAGTLPNDDTSLLAKTAARAGGDEVEIKWQSAADRTYEIEKSTNLTEGFTLSEAGGIAATPPENTHTVTVGGDGVGFYRVRVE